MVARFLQRLKSMGSEFFRMDCLRKLPIFGEQGFHEFFLHFFAYLKAYYDVPIVYIVYLLVIKIFIEACLSRITTVIEIFHQVIEYQAGAQ